jgi:hypothetical protein
MKQTGVWKKGVRKIKRGMEDLERTNKSSQVRASI